MASYGYQGAYPNDVTTSPLSTTAYKEHVTMTVGTIPVGGRDGHCPSADGSPSRSYLGPTNPSFVKPRGPSYTNEVGGHSPSHLSTQSPVNDTRRSTLHHLLASAATMFGAQDEKEPRYEHGETLSGRHMEYAGFVAAKMGHVENLERGLNDGLNVNASNGSYTLLMWAARTGAVPTAKLLLERGADPDLSAGAELMTPLILAAKHGYTSIAELLLTHRAHPDKPDDKMHSPLIYAAANGHYNTAQVLLDFGADLAWVATTDTSTDRHAAQMASIDTQFRLKPGTRVAIDWQERSDGKSALHVAARYGHGSIVELFVKYGVNVNGRDDGGKTPLNWAASRGHYEAVRTLCLFRALVDIPDFDGYTPLMWACRQGNTQIANLLIFYNADVNYCSARDRNLGPLTCAMQYSNQEMVSLLRRNGARVRTNVTPPELCGYCCW